MPKFPFFSHFGKILNTQSKHNMLYGFIAAFFFDAENDVYARNTIFSISVSFCGYN